MTELQMNATLHASPECRHHSAPERARPTVASVRTQVSGSQPPASADADLAALLPEALALNLRCRAKRWPGLRKSTCMRRSSLVAKACRCQSG